MSYYGRYSGFAPYVSVGEKKVRAARMLAKLRKKNKDISPIILTGSKIAVTWWGLSWNKNLERYADYEYRLDRGKSYVRHGSVLDLKISEGNIAALVQGSGRSPYKVSIDIKEINKKNWQNIKIMCEGKIDSLAELLEGSFPKELEALFFEKGLGLFPSPKEIIFKCSCLDWASMCKHVAAVLYGVGAKLDSNPSLFFELRNIDMKGLISHAVAEKKQKLLKKSVKKSKRVMKNADIGKVFGIDLKK